MRFLAIILSLLILGSSVAPCADDVANENIEISYQEKGLDHEHKSSEDLCSPLCVCHCCHSHLVFQQIFMSDLGSLTFPIQRNTYTEPIISGFITAILQPPQV